MKQKLFKASVLIFLTLLGACQQSDTAKTSANTADEIYFGGDIITMEGDNAVYAEAVAVKDGKIIFVGDKLSADKFKGDSTLMNDLKGKTMMPGFIDPHLHPSIAASILAVEITSAMEWTTPSGKSVVVKDRKTFMDRITVLAKEYETKGSVLYAWGYFKPYHGVITRKDLNNISTKVPIVIWQRSCHEFIMNDVALNYFGMTQKSFEKNDTTRAYSNWEDGHIWEAGLFVVAKRVVDSLGNPKQYKKGLEMMSTVFHKGGLTTVCEQGFPQIDLLMEQTLDGNEINKPTTPFRFMMVPNAMYLYPKLKTGAKLLAFCDSLIKTGSSKMDYVKAIKFYADGAIFSQLMKLSQPYQDCHHGNWMMDPKDQNDVFLTFWKAGWDIHIHVNGDGGLDTLFAIIDRARQVNPDSKSKIFMEHYGYAREDQHNKVAKYGLLVSNNPYYYYELSAPYSVDGLGIERASKISPVGSLEKRGVPLSFHSDYFMAPAEPLTLVWTAVNRVNSAGDTLAPEEKVSLWTAMKAVTTEAARSIRKENEIGSIKIGKKADFVILGLNPFKIDPIKIKDIPILETIFEGKSFPINNE